MLRGVGTCAGKNLTAFVCGRDREPDHLFAFLVRQRRRFSGRPDRDGGPCYACLFKETDEADESCAQMGVLAPVAGIIGCIQATETIKVLVDVGETLEGKLLLLDARTMEWRTLKLKRDPACPVCGNKT